MDLTQAVALFVAAFLAGIVNSIAGGGTLITFPVLLWVGLDAKIANATSTVALWPGLFGGFWGYRKEIEDSRTFLRRLGVTSLFGGAAGTALLVITPSEIFSLLVPFLILFATLLFMIQEQLSRRLKLNAVAGAHPPPAWWMGAIIVQFFSAIYGAYFGAGNGILMLAVIGLLGISDIHRANGIKTFLGFVLNSVAVIGFALTGLVNWRMSMVMVTGAILGGYYGTNIARRLGRAFVRRAVVAVGLTISAIMLWRLWS
ncbi:MAG: sulfite exporter TauE/SafE family protein [Pyrinomonadaceae bacterium]